MPVIRPRLPNRQPSINQAHQQPVPIAIPKVPAQQNRARQIPNEVRKVDKRGSSLDGNAKEEGTENGKRRVKEGKHGEDEGNDDLTRAVGLEVTELVDEVGGDAEDDGGEGELEEAGDPGEGFEEAAERHCDVCRAKCVRGRFG